MRKVQSSSQQQEKPNSTGKPKPKSRVQKLQQKTAALEAQRNQKSTGSSRRNRRGQAGRGKQDDEKPRRVPDEEWELLQKIKAPSGAKPACRFWNSSSGCTSTNCTWPHVCASCGQSHKWVDHHFKRDH